MDSKIEKLTLVTEKILLFGGVYSNLQALEALIEIAKTENIAPEHCFCTGDIIGYCAQPEETVQLFKKWGAKSIAGNVEVQLSENKDDCGCDFKEGSRCNEFSQIWYPFAKSKLSDDSLSFLSNLPHFIKFEFSEKKAIIVHGSFVNISEFIFKSTDWQIKEENFIKSNSDLIIAGHCGLPFHQEENELIWVNPGVIGMPANNGKPFVWFTLLENKNNQIEITHKKLHYNYTKTNELMILNDLPKEYSKTILTGIWDNTDILPTIEANQQGKKIIF